MCKLKLCSKELDKISEESPERADLFIAADNMKSELEELRENYTKFALLSQNGRGKSYILNLLMLMTADNEEEYLKNNKNLNLPQDFKDNTLLENLTEADHTNLPEVVKDFIKSVANKKKDFKTLLQCVCHQLPNVTNIDSSLKSLSRIESYFSSNARFNIDPYFLPQKGIVGNYESTTKCIIHLRYGSLYQMKVDYFSDEELKQQLFELVAMDKCDNTNENENIKEKAQECLQARYEILTDEIFSNTNKDTLRTPDDIPLSNEVLEFAGKTELYLGLGRNSTHDRLAIQSALKGLTNPQEDDESKTEEMKKRIAAVKEIVIYVPCKILYGGKEILEMPGTDDSDPIAMDFIRNALEEVDAVILITENGFKICEKEVKDMLSESRFLQKCMDDPDNYKLLLLTYPEKNSKWQFGVRDKDKIQKLEHEEKKKRDKELKEVRKMLNMESDSFHEEYIFTSYILPVLHTSILAQKGTEYKVIAENEKFLKITGIKNLIIQLDEFVLSRQKNSFNEVRLQLSHFHREINGEINREEARKIVQTLSVKSFKTTFEDSLNERSEQLEIKLRKNIEQMLCDYVKELVNGILPEIESKAVAKWKSAQDQVTTIGVYSPYFCGKNPIYKVCLFNILFDDLAIEQNSIFTAILDKINQLLDNYKITAIAHFTKELNTLLINLGSETKVTSEFVKGVIEDVLTDALKWYLGKKKLPFSQKTMKKYMEKSQRSSLQDIILKPNFKKSSLEESKKRTSGDIAKCFAQMRKDFIQRLLDLHGQRFGTFHGKLWLRNGSSKIWQQLISHIRSLSRDRDLDNQSDTINRLIIMLSVEFN
ncbi:uncharacterized protein LOC134927206 isoform X2 [Pseudophryne corroboree]